MYLTLTDNTTTFTPPAHTDGARPDVIPRSRSLLEDHPQAPVGGAWAGLRIWCVNRIEWV